MGRITNNTQLTQQIIDYLEQHCPVSKDKLCQDLHIVTRQKETLSEQFKKIKQKGFIIHSPIRSEIIESIEKPEYIYEGINNTSITNTLILMILSIFKRPLSHQEIEYQLRQFMNDEEIPINIYKYLNELKKNHYIICYNKKYSSSKLYPHFISNSANDYQSFFNRYEDLYNLSPTPDILEKIHFKIDLVIPNNHNYTSSHIISSQKGSSFNQQTIESLKLLSTFSYDKYQLQITYQNFKKEIQTFTFSTGMIVVSYEKNNIYLFGETNKQSTILKLANILVIKQLNQKNDIFESSKYKAIYDEMFSISIAPSYNVEILFKDLPNHNIRRKIYNLISIRNHNIQGVKLAHIVEQSQDDYFIYKDTVRGLNDLAKYLRSFGSNVTILEPLELRKIMIQSATKTIHNYEKRGIKL